MLWQESGLQEIVTGTFEIRMAFASFDDYWQPVLGRPTPTSAYVSKVNQLTRGALARLLREKISVAEPDGSIVLPARAFAVRGNVTKLKESPA
jgi:hypothetical protein